MSTPIRILYVDDYPLDRQLVRDALEREHDGFALSEAATRPEFEAALAAGGFDLVLSDFNILGFEGLQVLAAVQATQPGVPVVIVTGTGSEEVAVEAMKRGAADYVIKTVKHIRRLPVTIHAAIDKQRLAQERVRAEHRISRQLRQLSALRAIDSAITATGDLRHSLRTLIIEVLAQLQVDAAAVLLLQPGSRELVYGSGGGFRTAAIESAAVRLGDGPAGRAALERTLVAIPDLRQHPDGEALLATLAGEDFVSYYGVPLVAKDEVRGVLEIFHRQPLQPDADWLDFLETLAGQSAIAIDNAELFQDLQRVNAEMTVAYDATIEGWSRALDLRDKETEGHTRRVTEMTVELAAMMGLPASELVHVRRGALLHDIGKLGVPDHILLKPASLSEEEWGIMRRHPQYAHDLLAQISFLRPALDIPFCHHERWDGSGYPRGLRGEEIPLVARLFAVVDVWDALRSDRPYRPAWSKQRALDYVRSVAGTHFDPRVVAAFLTMLGAGEAAPAAPADEPVHPS